MAFGCDALRRIRFDECAGHARESMHRAFGNCIEGSRGRPDRPADLNSPAEEEKGHEARAPYPLYSPRPWGSPFGPACAVRARSHRAQSGPPPASGRRMGSVGLVPAGARASGRRENCAGLARMAQKTRGEAAMWNASPAGGRGCRQAGEGGLLGRGRSTLFRRPSGPMQAWPAEAGEQASIHGS